MFFRICCLIVEPVDVDIAVVILVVVCADADSVASETCRVHAILIFERLESLSIVAVFVMLTFGGVLVNEVAWLES